MEGERDKTQERSGGRGKPKKWMERKRGKGLRALVM